MSDKNGKIEPLTIKLIEGVLAPRFDVTTYELTPVCVNITEQGTAANLPLVDFVFTHGDQQFFFTTSGRMVLTIAAAIRGAIQRNHGTPEP